MASHGSQSYEFGPFRVDPAQRLLWRGDAIVSLTPKAFELLLVLVTSNGQVLTKDELLRRVWPDSFVEEANLSHNIYKLREALAEKQNGEKYIETLPRRGYRFLAKVTELRDEGVDVMVHEIARAQLVIEEQREPQSETRELSGSPQNILRGGAWPSRWMVIVIGLLVIAGSAAIYLMRSRRTPGAAPAVHSLAVLPFRPLSAEGRDEALELGMADALITRLSNVRKIVVRPTSAVLKYNDSAQDVLAAGREQGVDAVIDGKVQKVGERIRATVQLVRVSDGASLWAETFDDQFTNVFAVQDSISDRAARALVSQLSPEETQRLTRHYTDNIQAYQVYLEGRYCWARFSADGVSKSIDYYNQAISMDPSYALAYAGLADAYSVQGAMGIVSPIETAPRMKGAIDAALSCDPSLAQAHQAAGGLALLYQRDWPAAKRELDRAIELNPAVPDPHELLGYYWEVMGNLDRAQREFELARQAAPLMSVVNMDIGNLAYYRGQYGQAIDLYNQAHNLDPDFIPLPFFPAQAYERKGLYEQATSSVEQVLKNSPDDPALLAVLGYVFARAGKTKEAESTRTRLEQMQSRRYVSPFMLALLYSGMGDKDKAFASLDKAFHVQDPQLIWLSLDPEFDPLRKDPRFADLLHRLNRY
jgi:DNA-binding winged helix-turn-helix (wHTH) protein/TolB-like protein/Tfp pilus assembly protein PilF